MNYNTQLCNTALEKVFVDHLQLFLLIVNFVGRTKTFFGVPIEM